MHELCLCWPSDWNCLPNSLHLELLSLSTLQPQSWLKTFLFASPSTDAVREHCWLEWRHIVIWLGLYGHIIIIKAGFTTAEKRAFGQLTMQQLPTCMLRYTFRFRYNCTNCDQMHVKISPVLHYIFPYLWVENRIFNQFKELDLCWHCQMSSQVLSFTWFITQISKNLASTGGPHEISWRAGPRVGQHWSRT